MHIFSLIFMAVDTCVGKGEASGSVGIVLIQFICSLGGQIRSIFKVIKSNPDKQKAAAATIAIPLVFLALYVFITGMGMDYFIKHKHEEYIIENIENILTLKIFIVELLILSGIFIYNTYIYIPLSKINKIEIIISFAIPVITICISISIYICKFIIGANSFFEELLKINQFYLKFYVYGISSLVLTTINTTMGLFVYSIIEGKFPNRNNISLEDSIILNNRKKVKEYIFGYTKYYLFGVISACIGTMVLGIHFFYSGDEQACMILILCSCVYIPWIFKLIKIQFFSGKYKTFYLLDKMQDSDIGFNYFCNEIIDNPPKTKFNDNNEKILISKHFIFTRTKSNQKLELIKIK